MLQQDRRDSITKVPLAVQLTYPPVPHMLRLLLYGPFIQAVRKHTGTADVCFDVVVSLALMQLLHIIVCPLVLKGTTALGQSLWLI